MEVQFGNYLQCNDRANSLQPILWQVLKCGEGEALLLSRYCLDCETYHFKYASITWEDCNLRAWLYEVFLPRAFSQEEQRHIHFQPLTAAGCGTEGLTLLTRDECKLYFPTPSSSLGEATDYALSQLRKKGEIRTSPICSWWLRETAAKRAVAPAMNRYGFIAEYNVNDHLTLVRPAIFVDSSVIVNNVHERDGE